MHCIIISVPFPDPDAVTVLKLTGLTPVITKDLIEGYIYAEVDDVEVKSINLKNGNAIASVSRLTGKGTPSENRIFS